MIVDRRALIAGGALVAGGAGLLATGAGAQTPPPMTPGGRLAVGLTQPGETIDLWPDGAPGLPAVPPVERVEERRTDPALNDRAVSGVRVPRLAVFRPTRPNGASILLFPGGGYVREALDKEGYELARLLAARGVTAFVLIYRLPGDGWAQGSDVALSDAQRAMRVVRARAGRYGIDPARVAAMGFSAGGHLCADLVARYDAATYAPVDAADAGSARPFLAAPIYPVITMAPALAHGGSREQLLGPHPTPTMEAAHSPDRTVRPGAPPCFLCAAEDDATVPVENTLLFHAALRAAKVPVEMHLFARGGHGFGIRGAAGKPVAAWPELFWAWAGSLGWY